MKVGSITHNRNLSVESKGSKEKANFSDSFNLARRAKTKEECLEKTATWKNEQDGIYTQDANENWTIEQYANYWYDNYVVGKVKITTQSDDRSILDAHIISGIRQYRLNKIIGQALNRFYIRCANKPNAKGEKLSPITIKNIYTVANRMFKCAYKNEIIKENPNKKSKLPKMYKKRNRNTNTRRL